MIDVAFGADEEFTNTITGSVGPTTSTTSRALVDTNSAHYIWLNATTGSNSNAGTTAGAPKATLDGLTGAYAALAGARGIVYITDSSTYTRAGANLAFPAATANAADNAGIQAALGSTPIIEFTDSSIVTITAAAGGTKLLSGITLLSSQAITNASNHLVTITGSANTVTIADCLIFQRQTADPNLSGGSRIAKSTLLVSGNPTGTLNVVRNILLSQYNSVAVTLIPSTTALNVLNNIIYNMALPLSALLDQRGTYQGQTLATLTCTFNQATNVATITGGGPIVAGAYAGLMCGFSTNLYRIVGNSSDTIYLENVWAATQVSAAGLTTLITAKQPEALLRLRAPTTGTTSATLRRNILVGRGQQSGIFCEAVSTVTAITYSCEGNVVLGAQTGISIIRSDLSGTGDIASVYSQQNIYYTAQQTACLSLGGATETLQSGMSLFAADYSNSINPLYFNPAGALTPRTTAPFVDATLGYVKSAYDFRLRQRGKRYYTTSSPMISSSALVGLYSGADLDPWVETLTSGGVIYANELQINRPATSLAVAQVSSNPVEVHDLHGNLKIDWNAWRKTFTLTFDQGTYVSGLVIWKLFELLSDKKPKMMYPKGVGETMMPSSTDGALVASTATIAEFVPAGRAAPMRINHWAGFWISLVNGSGFEGPYYILSNDATTLTVIDKDLVGFPANGDYDFIIDQILVQNRTSAQDFMQPYFTQFDKGGTWDEQPESTTLAYEWAQTGIVFEEVENRLQ